MRSIETFVNGIQYTQQKLSEIIDHKFNVMKDKRSINKSKEVLRLMAKEWMIANPFLPFEERYVKAMEYMEVNKDIINQKLNDIYTNSYQVC